MIKIAPTCVALAFAVIATCGVQSFPASAQTSKQTGYFAHPVPSALSAAFADFLGRLQTKDPMAVIAKTRFAFFGASKALGFRIEDPQHNTCVNDRCLTIIGHMRNGRFVADVMFQAGASVEPASGVLPFFGIAVVPYFFKSEHGDVMLMQTPEGWLTAPVDR